MNAKEFVTRQLGTAGWAPIDIGAAQYLCPDADLGRDHQTFAAWQRTPDLLPRAFPGAALYRAAVPGLGDVLVLSRSETFLVERMEWFGLPATSVALVSPAVRPAARAVSAPKAPTSIPRRDQRIEGLRRLAAQEPPAHDCASRRDILAARSECDRESVDWQAAA